MTASVIPGGPRVPAELVTGGDGIQSVVHDDTLVGDGTTIDPLGVDPTGLAGAVAVVADGTSIAGNGVIGTPLHTLAGGTAIAVDGTSIAGNGLTGTPIHTIDGGTGVAVDGSTITGTGKTGNPLVANVGAVTVHTDSTLTGNGTVGVPLGLAPAIQIELAIAVANVAADGTVTASRGFSSIVHAATGQYTATLNVAPPTGDVVAIATIDSAGAVAIPLVQAASGGVIHVRTVAAADFAVGTTSDVAFYLAVFRTA